MLVKYKNNHNRSKRLLKVGGNFKKRFVFFGRNSGLHGFNHLFQENIICLARFFWLLVLAVSTGCLYLLIVPVIEADGGIYFTPETRYLEWTTNFPAITVCERTNTKFSQRTFLDLYPELLDPLAYAHQRFLTELLFARGTCSRTQCSPCGEFVPCGTNWRSVVEKVHKNCEELVSDCAFNNVKIPCCETFMPADSEHGPCYSFNALQNIEFTKKPLYAVNRSTGPGTLTFNVLADADVSIHSNEELATNSLSDQFNFPLRLLDANVFHLLFSVVMMENDHVLDDHDIHERQCRFVDEIPKDKIHTYKVYSHGACSLAQNTKHSFEHCACVSPVRDLSYENYYCNYTGMVCLSQYEVLKNKIGKDTHDDEDHEDCLPSCVESEIYIKHQSKSLIQGIPGPGIAVKIEMAGLPTLRYQRNLMKTKLDLVVSVGGMAGLFFGASVLSIVEIFYLILRKQ